MTERHRDRASPPLHPLKAPKSTFAPRQRPDEEMAAKFGNRQVDCKDRRTATSSPLARALMQNKVGQRFSLFSDFMT
jgi:hypothetical protein